MAYASVQDIADEFKNLTFSASTTVTDTKVTRFITEAEAEINGRVGLVYQVPVDSTNSPIGFALLRSLSIAIVSTRVKGIMEIKTADDATSQGKGGTTAADNARKTLKQIVDQELHLLDVPKASVADGVQSFGQQLTNPYGVGLCNETTGDVGDPLWFQKDQNQW